MMTLNKAMSLALESLARLTGRPRGDLLLINARTQCRRMGWIFFYESRAHLENGDLTEAVAATGPVVVTHLGAVHHLGGEQPSEKVLADFEWTQRRRSMLGSASGCDRTPR